MKFYDMSSEKVYTIQDMKSYYFEMLKEDPETFSEFGNFMRYYFVFLMDTINGRNDISIVSVFTVHELSCYIINLKEKVGL